MAAVNVRGEFWEQAESSNKECTSIVINKQRPITSNITSNTLSGDIIFDFNTGASEWLDLYNTHLVVKFDMTETKDVAEFDNLGQCMYDRGQLFINGVLVSSSNNWTEDSILNKRLSFGSDYNSTVNQFGYGSDDGDAAVAATLNYPVAVKYSVQEYLDALFMRTPNIILPPNTNIRIQLTPAPLNGLYKSIRGDGADTDYTIKVYDIYLNTHIIVKSDPVPDKYELSLIVSDSFKSTVGGTSHSAQYVSKPNLVRLSAFFIDTKAYGANQIKLYSVPNFRFETDNCAATLTDKLNTLYFKQGNQMLPQEQFDNTTYGLFETYSQINVLANHTLDPAGSETMLLFKRMGQYYTVPVVKSSGDTSKNIELHCTFASAPTCYAFLTAHNEQIVSFVYTNGVPTDTQKLF